MCTDNDVVLISSGEEKQSGDIVRMFKGDKRVDVGVDFSVKIVRQTVLIQFRYFDDLMEVAVVVNPTTDVVEEVTEDEDEIEERPHDGADDCEEEQEAVWKDMYMKV